MRSNLARQIRTTLLAALLAGTTAISGAQAAEAIQGDRPPEKAEKRKSTSKPKSKVAAADWRAKRGLYYQRTWGVDIVGVRPTSSGYMLRFDYRVLDPKKAAVLKDRKAKAYIIDEKTQTALAVPAMENIGELRQVAPLEVNRTYYVIFGNPGKLVKRGSRVTVVVGEFRAELVVD